MEYYLQSHKSSRYLPGEQLIPGIKKYSNRFGWDDFYMGQHLIFSHRKTIYDLTVFPEKLHSHSFYEMNIYVEGKISYISDNQEIFHKRMTLFFFLRVVFILPAYLKKVSITVMFFILIRGFSIS